MTKWICRLVLLLAGGAAGWFGRGWYDSRHVLQPDAKQEAPKPASPEPEQISFLEWDEKIDQMYAEAEHPSDDLPEEIEVPQLPFEAGEVTEEEEVEEEEDGKFLPFYDAPRIEIITEQQYIDAYNGYSKDTLLYYSDIDELTFGDEDRVDDKDAFVAGPSGKVYYMFFDDTGKKRTDVVYIRNNRIGIDFMIVQKDGVPYWYDGK